jgi:hypothetical protein
MPVWEENKPNCDGDYPNQTIEKRLASVRGPGVEPVFLDKKQAIEYARDCASFFGNLAVLFP